jgi:glycosyltransferase involved in cell wall biosynthesis
MKRIVIDARELRTSTGRYVANLLDQLQEVDTDLSHRYIVLLTPKDMDTWIPHSKRFTKVACRFKEFTLAEQTLMALQLYRLKADLVHSAMIQQPVLYLKKVVTTAHDITNVRFDNPAKNKLIFTIKRWVYVRVIHIVVFKSKRIITPTEYIKDDIARFTNANSRKFTVTLESGDSIDDKPKEMPELIDKQFIMYVGRPTPHKNLERLIDAFETLQAEHPDLRLVLAGKTDANYRRIARLVKRRDIQNIVFTDFISDGQLRWLYEHCAAYVFPSLSEGFGLPGLEAMSHGAPVVSSNATCLPEVHGEAAHYFDPLDVEDMTRAINDVLTDETLRQDLISRGAKQVKKFSWERMARQTLDVYNSILGE